MPLIRIYRSMLSGISRINFNMPSDYHSLVSSFNNFLYQTIIRFGGDDCQLFDIRYCIIRSVSGLPFVYNRVFEMMSVMHEFHRVINDDIRSGSESSCITNEAGGITCITTNDRQTFYHLKRNKHLLFAEVHSTDFLESVPGLEHRMICDGSLSEIFSDNFLYNETSSFPSHPEHSINALLYITVEFINLVPCPSILMTLPADKQYEYISSTYNQNTPNYAAYRVMYQMSFHNGSILKALNRGINPSQLGKIEVRAPAVRGNQMIGLSDSFLHDLSREHRALETLIEETLYDLASLEEHRDVLNVRIGQQIELTGKNQTYEANEANSVIHWSIGTDREDLKTIEGQIVKTKNKLENARKDMELLTSQWTAITQTEKILIPSIDEDDNNDINNTDMERFPLDSQMDSRCLKHLSISI